MSKKNSAYPIEKPRTITKYETEILDLSTGYIERVIKILPHGDPSARNIIDNKTKQMNIPEQIVPSVRVNDTAIPD